MQIYYTDTDPARCAANLPDALTNKILVEVAQILCTVCHKHGINAPYKPTHENHPFVKWASECWGNFDWLHCYSSWLCHEYMTAYNKTTFHKSFIVARKAYLSAILNQSNFKKTDQKSTEPPRVFVEEFTEEIRDKWNWPIDLLYRGYLNWKVNKWRKEGKNKRLYTWTNRTQPRNL